MTEDWTKWENLVINGVFPLRRFLGKLHSGERLRLSHTRI
jgi:hypothetical protein